MCAREEPGSQWADRDTVYRRDRPSGSGSLRKLPRRRGSPLVGVLDPPHAHKGIAVGDGRIPGLPSPTALPASQHRDRPRRHSLRSMNDVEGLTLEERKQVGLLQPGGRTDHLAPLPACKGGDARASGRPTRVRHSRRHACLISRSEVRSRACRLAKETSEGATTSPHGRGDRCGALSLRGGYRSTA
jgi:hypothetical protein